MKIPSLEIDTLVRSIGVNKGSPHAMFLGAGASVSSGVPSAERCIWHWKRSIFCTNNPGLEKQVEEISLPSVRERIDRWLRVNGHSPDNQSDEYSYYIEKCYPIADNRRRFFEPWIRQARPHVGYRLLCLLAESCLFQSIWTTNFDNIVSKAAAEFDLSLIEVGLDTKERAFRQPDRNELTCVSLHGDYRYDPLKNTSSELQAQEKELKKAFIGTLSSHSLVVTGYSGRDPSIMEAIRAACLQEEFVGKLYWCGYSDEPSAPVSELLSVANELGKVAYYVAQVAFDDLMSRVALHILGTEAIERAKDIIGKYDSKDRLPLSSFTVAEKEPTAIIKSNAWPISFPAEMFEVEPLEWPETGAWKWLRKITSSYQVVAVPFRTILAFGTIDDIRTAFSGIMKGDIKRVPITDRDIRFEDGAVISLMLQALVRSIAQKKGLNTDGRNTLWERMNFTSESEGSKSFNVHKALRLSIRRIGDQSYIVFDPTIYVHTDKLLDQNAVKTIRMRILGYQHNNKYNAELNHWRELILTKGAPTVFDYPPDSSAFKFRIKSAPAFATIRQPKQRRIAVTNSFSRLIHNHGLEIPEQLLRFSDMHSSTGTDTMPIRGLSHFGPYDQILSPKLDDGPIKVGIICPRAESGFLEAFLTGGLNSQRPNRGQREEYLVEYKGFESVYKTPIVFPCRGDRLWHTLPEIDSKLDEREGSLELSRIIRDALSTLSLTERAIYLILTPERWQRWRGFSNEQESFDVHDFIKAYCVQNGIASQFLDQNTLRYKDKCRIWWWLSVALYAKSMRTPWVIDGLDRNSAFVGLGYSINHKAPKGNQIVLGCSHIYNSQGQGLQFRLSRIENPIIVGGNPFLSYQDALRLGENIRTLFWESHLRLPERVVIHKQTPFRIKEQQGLKDGLHGVKDVELLEINYESALRYVSSIPTSKGFKEGNYPVRRGTTLKLTENEALIWVHGSTEAARASWTYYQGKRRIPSPIKVKRYAGESDLATISNEILGLSKMDWNSGDLYSKLPATILSSKRIARIGTLLGRFGNFSYDYRLFM